LHLLCHIWCWLLAASQYQQRLGRIEASKRGGATPRHFCTHSCTDNRQVACHFRVVCGVVFGLEACTQVFSNHVAPAAWSDARWAARCGPSTACPRPVVKLVLEEKEKQLIAQMDITGTSTGFFFPRYMRSPCSLSQPVHCRDSQPGCGRSLLCSSRQYGGSGALQALACRSDQHLRGPSLLCASLCYVRFADVCRFFPVRLPLMVSSSFILWSGLGACCLLCDSF
jgi:hypothetical protein